ncbi:Squalene monooxygenase [Porphyridium purpureum]|uniref:Squalene monooxygenase n=1 Tax=Porphyridium purpureum TaxID=35688 RepID=A0A5J4YZY9_PORPP|nr:Squalene monooxygenase [Porphyridium purpureum]|eukprot:POR2448..scf209_3
MGVGELGAVVEGRVRRAESVFSDAQDYDVLVVGAGVAGASLATVLARDGRSVLLVERDLAEQSRIVGELLQPGGVRKLVELGLEQSLESIDSQPVYGYGIFLEPKRMCIRYKEQASANNGGTDGWTQATRKDDVERSSGAEAPELPRSSEFEHPADAVGPTTTPRIAGRSFHNGRFVQRLRELAAAEQNVTLVQGNVVELVEERVAGAGTRRVIGVKLMDDEKKEHVARAKLTIACDGCSSRLRKQVNPAAEYDVFSQFVGLVLKNVDMPFPKHGHVILGDRAPVLFYQISSTEVRCLVDVPASARSSKDFRLRDYLMNVVLPQVPIEFQAPFERAVTEDQLRSMPNRVMPANPTEVPGALLLGDSFNMRHPLTGGGMTVALSDVALLRRVLTNIVDLGDDVALRSALDVFYRTRREHSSTINILANALYSVFCASDDASLTYMRDACFDYLSSGGRRSTDPVSMLGGLNGSTTLLVMHFFAVAVYGCGRVLFPFPTPRRLATSWQLFRSAFNIVKPLIDAEKATFLSWIPISRI